MTSITYRITGLMFMLIFITVFLMVYLANVQMTSLFEGYLGGFHRNIELASGGVTEKEFLASVHQALKWVGALILLVGLAASYMLARSITVPLRQLSTAVRGIEQGNYGKKVTITTNDEVQQLAMAFNHMVEGLESSARLRKQLLADIAHELRTPLAIIQGNLEGMFDGVIPADKEQLSSLIEETGHLNRLIGDLRDLSLAEAGQLKLDKSAADVNGLVARGVALLGPVADSKGISIITQLGSVPIAEVDARRINQIVYNLVANAIRYTPSSGNIIVSTSWDDQLMNIVISVCDDGQGIAPEDLPNIFDHFYRADKSRTRSSGGSGIGLAIVKQLVELHGGKVEVSSSLGQGSCFKVALPFVGNN